MKTLIISIVLMLSCINPQAIKPRGDILVHYALPLQPLEWREFIRSGHPIGLIGTCGARVYSTAVSYCEDAKVRSCEQLCRPSRRQMDKCSQLCPTFYVCAHGLAHEAEQRHIDCSQHYKWTGQRQKQTDSEELVPPNTTLSAETDHETDYGENNLAPREECPPQLPLILGLVAIIAVQLVIILAMVFIHSRSRGACCKASDKPQLHRPENIAVLEEIEMTEQMTNSGESVRTGDSDRPEDSIRMGDSDGIGDSDRSSDSDGESGEGTAMV